MRTRAPILITVAAVAGLVLISPRFTHANAPPRVTGRSVAPPPAQFGLTVLRGPPAARRAVRVVVGFGPDASRREKQRAVAGVGGSVEASIGTLDASVVDVPDSKVTQAVR